MAKEKSWFNFLKRFSVSDTHPKPEKKEKRRKWTFGKLKASSRDKTWTVTEKEQRKHAHTVAIDLISAAEFAAEAAAETEAAAEAVMKFTRTPQTIRECEELAAIQIQTAFRGYLAKRALRVLKGIVRIQAIFRGRIVRRQAIATLMCLQSLTKVQSQIRSNGQRKWDGNILTKKEADGLKEYTVSQWLHEGNKKKLLYRPSRLAEIEELPLPDSNMVQRTDVAITSNRSPPESPTCLIQDSSPKHGGASDNSSAATEISSDTNTDDPINVLYDEEGLEDISSPVQESLNVSEISQLKRMPPKLYSLKIEACNALKSFPKELMHNNLRHLYIIDCHFLKFIQASHLPIVLKTLYIRKCKKVEFLFPMEKMGKHTSLEHLCIQSSCDSLNSFPLDFFPKLKNLSICDCANFNSISITEDHVSLNALEIRDCAKLKSLYESVLCTPNLTSILLSNCKILKVLPGQLNRLTSLQSLFINECPELESIPKGGLPSSLNVLCISSCQKLTPGTEWGMNTLSNFSRIEIEGGCRDLESFPEQNLLPRNLYSLRISRLPNLKVLDYKGLRHLSSLETLKINSCNKLQSLPEEGLPSSLTHLHITECPLLKSKLQNRRGKEWYKIAHIPHIQID
ncbi:hypothetical protein ACOSQ2_019165 [Xanthoceras sorbifolium]